MRHVHAMIIVQRLVILQSASLLSYPNYCSEADCIFQLAWTEWTPHIYNVTIESSNPPLDISLALSISNSPSFHKIILCSEKSDNASSVKIFDGWNARPYNDSAVFLGHVKRNSRKLLCTFCMLKQALPKTRFNVDIYTVSIVPRHNSSFIVPLRVYELGRDVEFRDNDRYFIRGRNSDTKFALIHSICMLTAYATVFTLSLFLSRYMKRISYGQKWQNCYVALLLLTMTIQAIGLFSLLGLHDKLDMTPLKFHRFSGILVTVLLGIHFIFILLKPYLEQSRLKKHVSHLSMILSMLIFLLSFSCCFTGLTQLTGLPKGTMIYIACYMFLIIVVGFVFSEILYIYYPVKIEGYFKTLKLSFVIIAVFICLFGLSIPVMLFLI
jgi:hypothetical protein